MRKDLLYALCCLAFAIIIGAAVYEHLIVVPRWTAAPPVSLAMFQGPYGLKPELFWKLIHPVNMLLFGLALLTHWKSARRKPLLIVLSAYITILAITAVYFVPELIAITTTPISNIPDPELTRRASLWEVLSHVRLGVLVILSLVLFTGLTRPGNHITAGRRTHVARTQGAHVA